MLIWPTIHDIHSSSCGLALHGAGPLPSWFTQFVLRALNMATISRRIPTSFLAVALLWFVPMVSHMGPPQRGARIRQRTAWYWGCMFRGSCSVPCFPIQGFSYSGPTRTWYMIATLWMEALMKARLMIPVPRSKSSKLPIRWSKQPKHCQYHFEVFEAYDAIATSATLGKWNHKYYGN